MPFLVHGHLIHLGDWPNFEKGKKPRKGHGLKREKARNGLGGQIVPTSKITVSFFLGH